MSNKLRSVGKICDKHGTVFREWNIEDLPKLCEGTTNIFHLISPSFEMIGATWNIIMYQSKSGMCKLYLQKQKSKCAIDNVYFNTEVKVHGKVIHSNHGEMFISDRGEIIRFTALNITELQPEDTVAVLLGIYPSKDTFFNLMSSSYSATLASEGIDTLLTNIEDLYLKQQDCDLKIRVKTREFGVHKTILAARSPVLYSMLHHDMVEKNTGVIDIIDFEPDIIEKFLIYLYTGRVDGLSWKNVTNLYTLGDKYDLQCLKKKCCWYMLFEISINKFCEVLGFAVKYEESTLLKGVEDFFVKNARSILPSKEWQEFLKIESSVCNDLFMKYIDSQSRV